MASERYDIIIIGTGAGGGTLAHRLAPSGKRILLRGRVAIPDLRMIAELRPPPVASTGQKAARVTRSTQTDGRRAP
jgi:choline dehydrogenase-like flavoprotein